MSSSSSSKRLPTLREWDDKFNISGLRKNDEEAARKNREEAKKDVELQARVDKVMERLRAMIEVKKNESAAGECDQFFLYFILFIFAFSWDLPNVAGIQDPGSWVDLVRELEMQVV